MARNNFDPQLDGRASARRSLDGKTVALHNFRGINNRDAADRLGTDEVRDAVNVDLDRRGRFRRRSGSHKILDTTTARSMWSDRAQQIFFADGENLKRISRDEGDVSFQTLYSALHPTNPVSFWRENEIVYITDQVNNRKLSLSGVVSQWGLATPSFTVTPTATGTLCCGSYKVTVTAQAADGEESGARVTQVDLLEDNTGISVQVPASPFSDVVQFNVYMSETDGETLYRSTTITSSGGTAVITSIPAGRRCETVGLERLPAGSSVAFYNGRFFVASGKYVYHSQPLRYGLYDPSTDFFQYPANVDLLACTEGGLFISADKTYRVRGESDQTLQQSAVFDYGAPSGRPEYVQAEDLNIDQTGLAAAWLSDEGFVIADPSGNIKNVTKERLVLPKYAASAIMYRQVNGIEQLVSTVSRKTDNRLTVTDDWSVEVRRNGVKI